MAQLVWESNSGCETASPTDGGFRLEYAIASVKANGKTSKKVFEFMAILGAQER
jgi:hypothetical protein